ncbi:MAG: glucokinase [Armatimonadota bacterium]|nr:glucokinase [Armatimonadota bacterium]MDR7422441.1 glucokinase [Armatimonadota bacterium]MDR7454415.1 glucokinase [Armatimonadota bacterium]MDR7457073.1 glucokinase [Armatimonadota bacterium]MDR7496937.1 glucokinase [Armatimonadota bacterium]
MLLLVGDVGGTKTDLAVFVDGGDLRAPVAYERIASAAFADLEAAVGAFLARTGLGVERACIAVAGPVVGGRVELTNLPWVVDAASLAARLGVAAVDLLNDLEAVAHAIPHLGPDDVRTLHAGVPAPGGALAVIAPGTGLGQAFLTWDGTRHRAHPSEGGHADFAPADELQVELLRFLRARIEHVSVERVASGLGLSNVYDFLLARGAEPERPEVTAAIAAAPDRTRAIIEAARDARAPSRLCQAALALFVDALGAEAGNLALKVLATGGVYLAGGMVTAIGPALDRGFMRAFVRKDRYAGLLGRMPVHAITNPRVALLGAARRGFELAGVPVAGT